jgi:hypothetical protein
MGTWERQNKLGASLTPHPREAALGALSEGSFYPQAEQRVNTGLAAD